MKYLPKHPNLDFLKKETKTLRALHRKNSLSACPRLRHYDTSLSGKSDEEILHSRFSILDAQRVIAREYGFSSWAKLKRFIESTKSKFNQYLHDELISLRDRDNQMRQELLDAGVLYDGYHPDMESVHNENAQRLEEIINNYGWPGTSLVGVDGCRAAGLIAQHAISQPTFMRKCLSLLKQATEDDQIPARMVAFLTDSIRYHEQKPQMYGLAADWNRQGELTFGEIEDEERVNERRALVGLEPIEDDLADHRRKVAKETTDNRAQDHDQWQKMANTWARKVGWR